MELIKEGKAKFYASRDKNGKISRELDVFYNPVMKFNRDISVLVLNNVGVKDFQVADIMAGSGVRSLRFLLELKKGVMKNLFVNDIDRDFVSLFRKNLKLNKLSIKKVGVDKKHSMRAPRPDNRVDIKIDKNILITSKDANMMLLEYNGCDYIEIDPFGSPNDFLASSIVRLSRGGILAVTGTDTASLSGTHFNTCMRSYWGRPLHNGLMHEVGLRILIRKIQLVASQHDKALVPIYCYFKDHYNRMIFRCVKGKLEADKLLDQHKYLLYCNKCLGRKISKYNNLKCDNCKELMGYSGPMWTGKLWDEKLAEKISKSNKDKDNIKFLELIMHESKLDAQGVFGFYDIHELCKHYKLTIPNTEDLMKQIFNKGHKVSRTHFTLLGIKTDMPISELVKVITLLEMK
jgi:tRNA (guanine26-N2/guanine27-N2)-dimethyltransferase